METRPFARTPTGRLGQAPGRTTVVDADMDAFMEWFRLHGGFVDMQAMGITEFSQSGRGAIALRDIPEGHTLFTLPRALTLSTRTSPLPTLFGFETWRAYGLYKGWVGLILCMMWEDAWAHELNPVDGCPPGANDLQPKWGPYIRTLPTTFDTPMFWSAAEIEELRGTAVIDKLGREDAEQAYAEQLIPAINTSPTLFPPSHPGKWYTLDAYHRAGSRILSRSFMVSRWADDNTEENQDPDDEVEEGRSDADDAEGPDPKTTVDSSMHCDDAHPHPSLLNDANGGADSDSEDDEDFDSSDVAMVPMADLLNARWGSENAKLFYEPTILRMATTKNIKHGEQIFNTYGDLPNSDLLRRYGHVDLVQLPSSVPMPNVTGDVEMRNGGRDAETIKHLGNPSDIVEIRADLVVEVIRTGGFGPKEKDEHARIEWWLDEGEDDTFVLGFPEPSPPLCATLPPTLISLIRLLNLSEPDFESARSKRKLPKGNLKNIDIKDSKNELELLDEVFKRREGMYVGGSVEDDERLLSETNIVLTERKRHAVIVRLGEKRILRDIRWIIGATLVKFKSTSDAGYRNEKDAARRHQKGGNGGRGSGGDRKRAVNGTEGSPGRKRTRK